MKLFERTKLDFDFKKSPPVNLAQRVAKSFVPQIRKKKKAVQVGRALEFSDDHILREGEDLALLHSQLPIYYSTRSFLDRFEDRVLGNFNGFDVSVDEDYAGLGGQVLDAVSETVLSLSEEAGSRSDLSDALDDRGIYELVDVEGYRLGSVAGFRFYAWDRPDDGQLKAWSDFYRSVSDDMSLSELDALAEEKGVSKFADRSLHLDSLDAARKYADNLRERVRWWLKSDDELRKQNPFYRINWDSRRDDRRRRKAAAKKLDEFLEDRVSKYQNFESRADVQQFFKDYDPNGDLDRFVPEAYALVMRTCELLKHEKARLSKDGIESEWSMVPYPAQLMAALTMRATGDQPNAIAEVMTGEGKTLINTMPAFLHSLTGGHVDIWTHSDSLAARDREWTAPLWEALGVSTSVVDDSVHSNTEKRIRAYNADVRFSTAKSTAFSKLRGMREKHPSKVGYFHGQFLLCDEADSVLFDSATNPAILNIPSAVQNGDVDVYSRAAEVVKSLVGVEETPSSLSVDTVQQRLSADYVFDKGVGTVSVQEPAIYKLAKEFDVGADDVFSSSDLGAVVINAIRAKEFLKRGEDYEVYTRAELLDMGVEKSRITKDVNIVIIDSNTKKPLFGHFLQDGLMEAVEAKEGIPAASPRGVGASVTIQALAKEYPHLAGSTGTGQGIEKEAEDVYGLSVTPIPRHKMDRRTDLGWRFYASREAKLDAVVGEILHAYSHKGKLDLLTSQFEAEGLDSVEVSRRLSLIGCGSLDVYRPILAGVRNRQDAEYIEKKLREKLDDVNIQVLTAEASQAKREREIISQGGKHNTITIATAMAGRGADMELDAISKSLGGLYVINAEVMPNQRVNDQLLGRGGRQGDSGLLVQFSSLEDAVFANELSVLDRREVLNMLRPYAVVFNDGSEGVLTRSQVKERTSEIGSAVPFEEDSYCVEVSRWGGKDLDEVVCYLSPAEKKELFDQKEYTVLKVEELGKNRKYVEYEDHDGGFYKRVLTCRELEKLKKEKRYYEHGSSKTVDPNLIPCSARIVGKDLEKIKKLAAHAISVAEGKARDKRVFAAEREDKVLGVLTDDFYDRWFSVAGSKSDLLCAFLEAAVFYDASLKRSLNLLGGSVWDEGVVDPCFGPTDDDYSGYIDWLKSEEDDSYCGAAGPETFPFSSGTERRRFGEIERIVGHVERNTGLELKATKAFVERVSRVLQDDCFVDGEAVARAVVRRVNQEYAKLSQGEEVADHLNSVLEDVYGEIVEVRGVPEDADADYVEDLLYDSSIPEELIDGLVERYVEVQSEYGLADLDEVVADSIKEGSFDESRFWELGKVYGFEGSYEGLVNLGVDEQTAEKYHALLIQAEKIQEDSDRGRAVLRYDLTGELPADLKEFKVEDYVPFGDRLVANVEQAYDKLVEYHGDAGHDIAKGIVLEELDFAWRYKLTVLEQIENQSDVTQRKANGEYDFSKFMKAVVRRFERIDGEYGARVLRRLFAEAEKVEKQSEFYKAWD